MVPVTGKGNKGNGGPNTLIRLEEAAFVMFSIYLFTRLPFAWWVFPLFFFTPDISLIGHVADKRAGAWIYNVIHHKAVALGAYIAGGLLGNPLLSLASVILLGHSSFDRVVGLGFLETAPAGTISQPVTRQRL